MEVGDWLRSLGLGQYEAAFRENEIDSRILPKLTSEDLKELGVAALGHRRAILSAIGELSGPSAAVAPVAENATLPASRLVTDAAERRQLTVMFCDLVGSTAMSARLDPEDMRAIIGAYHTYCATLIASNGGFVAKYMGDGVLAYFGYPQAHEHDAERAVRAGLAIVEAAPKLVTAAGAPLHVRVGIATGIVVVGDLVGSGEAQERGVVGDTPNLAARLQTIATPDSVVIAAATRKLLGNLFEVRDLGPQDLKGVAEPTRAFVALKETARESRFEALHAGGLIALVGRGEESDLLLRRWAKVNGGEGEVVLLSGEAGIGKSRLTASFLEQLGDEPYTRMRYFCTPQHTDSALFPIIGHMERAAGLTRDDDAKTRLDKLDVLLAASATSRNDASLIAELLSLTNDGRYAPIEISPALRRQKTMEALIGQIEAISRRKPLLMIFEDAHWADASSLELLGRMVDKIQTLRVLLFVTFRPEFAAPWTGRPHVSALTLNRLTQSEVGALIDRVVGNKRLPDDIRKDIVERTDGIPLFVEEMTKAVLEAESEGIADHMIATVPLRALSVPASLHASLMARLDRLGPAKEVAQVGAAIGRNFSHDLLAVVMRKTEAELGSALDRLIQAGLLFRQGVPPHVSYLFKHALVQDAAYGTLLREPRRALHASIVEALKSQFPDVADSQPELLARHCAEAGLIGQAAALWGKAGERSLARLALAEAEAHLTNALAQIARLPGTPALRREQIGLQVDLANARMHAKGFAASDTRASLEEARLLIERAEALGEPPEDELVLYSILYGFWIGNFAAFNGKVMRELSAQFLELAEKSHATVPIMNGHRLMGASLLLTGDIADGRTHLDRALALHDPAAHGPLATRFGLDAGVVALHWRALTLWSLGYPEAARADIGRAVSTARQIGHATTLAYALGITAWTQGLRGNYETAKAQASEAIELANEKGASYVKTAVTMTQGWAFALAGEASRAVRLISFSMTAYRSAGATMGTPLILSGLAKAHAELGQFDDARRRIDEAIAEGEASGEKWNEADLHRWAGEIALASPERDENRAQAHFQRALEIARAQQARSWELRAATSMARLWRDQDRRHQAFDLLGPVYGWFTEGFDTLDLKEAEALLRELA